MVLISSYETDVSVLIMKANEMHSFSNLFDKVLYMFRTCPLSIIRSISTLYTQNRYLYSCFCIRFPEQADFSLLQDPGGFALGG